MRSTADNHRDEKQKVLEYSKDEPVRGCWHVCCSPTGRGLDLGLNFARIGTHLGEENSCGMPRSMLTKLRLTSFTCLPQAQLLLYRFSFLKLLRVVNALQSQRLSTKVEVSDAESFSSTKHFVVSLEQRPAPIVLLCCLPDCSYSLLDRRLVYYLKDIWLKATWEGLPHPSISCSSFTVKLVFMSPSIAALCILVSCLPFFSFPHPHLRCSILAFPLDVHLPLQFPLQHYSPALIWPHSFGYPWTRLDKTLSRSAGHEEEVASAWRRRRRCGRNKRRDNAHCCGLTHCIWLKILLNFLVNDF